MAGLPRGTAVAQLQQLIDDSAGKLWSTSNLQMLLSNTVDELWSDLLDAFPYLRSDEFSGGLTFPGYADMSTAVQRFYRVQSLSRDGVPFREADPRDVLIAANVEISAPRETYVVYENQIHIFPYQGGLPLPTIRYSSLPTFVADLASDSDIIEWPEGHQNVYLYETAARAMERGDRESSDRFQARADKAMKRLLSYLRKRSAGPIVPYGTDQPQDWGGV